MFHELTYVNLLQTSLNALRQTKHMTSTQSNKFSKKNQIRVFKAKKWTTKYVDDVFSKEIRERDPLCRRDKCGPSSDCSHFWGRGHSATRFDRENCIGLARKCHDIWEHQKNTEYRQFMIDWLGEKKYLELELRARSFKNRTDAVQEYMNSRKG